MGEVALRVETRQAGAAVIIDLIGNIKTNEDYSVFKKAIDDAIQEGEAKLILNFKDVHFINSSGLGRLILAAKRARDNGGSLKIVRLSDDLRELFSFTRLDAKIEIYETEEEALATFI